MASCRRLRSVRSSSSCTSSCDAILLNSLTQRGELVVALSGDLDREVAATEALGGGQEPLDLRGQPPAQGHGEDERQHQEREDQDDQGTYLRAVARLNRRQQPDRDRGAIRLLGREVRGAVFVGAERRPRRRARSGSTHGSRAAASTRAPRSSRSTRTSKSSARATWSAYLSAAIIETMSRASLAVGAGAGLVRRRRSRSSSRRRRSRRPGP